jgi:Family of unknown function (DUF6498)
VSPADAAPASAHKDPSVYALIAANAVALALARDAGLRLGDMVAIYWAQSLVIGIAHTVRIAGLRKFTMGELVDPGAGACTKYVVAGAFFIHYTLFHLILGVALDARVGFYRIESAQAAVAWYCVILFAANHAFSLYYNIRCDRLGEPSLYRLNWIAYARVLPMHAVLGVFALAQVESTAAWLAFGLSKTVADVCMHVIQHRVLRQ